MTDRIAKLERMLEADPNDPFCLYGLGLEHLGRGAPRVAVQWLERAAAADPGAPYAWYHLARARAECDDQAGALAALDAGRRAALAAGDAKAASEIAQLRDELED